MRQYSVCFCILHCPLSVLAMLMCSCVACSICRMLFVCVVRDNVCVMCGLSSVGFELCYAQN